MLLSTHIVEDVAILCPRFAVIRQGELVAETSPTAARDAIDGGIFEGRASSAELTSLQQRFCVTQAILVEGENRVRIYEPGRNPPVGFHAVSPTLEDAYLLTMRNGALPGQSRPAGDDSVESSDSADVGNAAPLGAGGAA